MIPIFHLIGNVTINTDGSVSLEPINDASGVTYYGGLYHVWHQCCQNHWDHVISRDLIHWQRLPPPIQPVTLKTWDGSITLLPGPDGGPVILYDAQDGKTGSHGQDPRGPLDSPIVGVARPVNASDPYLMVWERADNNPVTFIGPPIAFPGPIWKNGDYYNFVGQGQRFQSNDTTFHTWQNFGAFVGDGETSGDWWMVTPNQVDGSPPPPGSPNRVVNVGNGDVFLLGTYDPANETFTPWSPPGHTGGVEANLERGTAGWFGASGGTDNNGRMMMIGWAMPDFQGPLTRLTLLREVNWDTQSNSLVANPVPELVGLRNGTVASVVGVPLSPTPYLVPGTDGGAASSVDINFTFSNLNLTSVSSFGACVLSNGTVGSGLGITFSIGGNEDYYMPDTDLPGGDYNVTNVNYSDPHICQAACTADVRCLAYTYVTRPPLVGSCCLKSVVPTPHTAPTCTSGVKSGATPTVNVFVGPCGVTASEAAAAAGTGNVVSSFPLLDDTSINVRILPDRSVVDFFVNGGRWSGTVSWLGTVPRRSQDSSILAWSNSATEGIVADVDVWSMGCGWADPSYTDNPTL